MKAIKKAKRKQHMNRETHPSSGVEKSIHEAIKRITPKPTQKHFSIQDTLAIGEVLYKIKQGTSGTKEMNAVVRREYHDLSLRDAAFRSNSLRLYRAYIGECDNDLLDVVGVDSFEELPYENPTVMIRKYRELKEAKN